MGQIKKQVQEMEDIEIEGAKLKSQIKWLNKGDFCTKGFFKIMQEKKRNFAITCLKNKDGFMTTLIQKVEETYLKHFNLYMTRMEMPTQEQRKVYPPFSP